MEKEIANILGRIDIITKLAIAFVSVFLVSTAGIYGFLFKVYRDSKNAVTECATEIAGQLRVFTTDITDKHDKVFAKVGEDIGKVAEHVEILNKGREANAKEIVRLKEQIKSVIRVCRLQHKDTSMMYFLGDGDNGNGNGNGNGG